MSFFKPSKPAPVATPRSARSASTVPAGALFDPPPLPEVKESDSDTSWALWEDSVQSQNPELDAQADMDTVPMPLAEEPAEKPGR
ncbi:MAG: hypothetical protein IPH37_01560 [Burkholderiales bacterium]|jgi:hypothetical protein|nr:hypothetical protein [Burkholderiales bacterium]MBK9348291.1 hypothetical protein [Burkholderiales bacterium]